MKKRVLVADDERNVAKVLKDRLVHWGYEVETASDGEEALRKIESFRPHLLILDVRMPKVDGLEVLDKTKKQNSHIGVLVFTASQSEDTKKTCIEKGADGFMLKPFNPQSVKEKVEEVLKICSD